MICLLHMEHMNVVVIVDDLLVVFLFVVCWGSGILCDVSGDEKPRCRPLWRRPRLVGRRRGLGLPCGSREIQPLIVAGWIIWVRDLWFLHRLIRNFLLRWRVTGETSRRRSLSSHCVTCWNTIVGQ